MSTNTYKADRSGLLDKVTFGNNGQVEYTYDDYDRLSGVKYDGETGQRYTYQYGANGRVAFVHDNHLNRTLQSEYDLAERPVQLTQRDANGNLHMGCRWIVYALQLWDRIRMEVNNMKKLIRKIAQINCIIAIIALILRDVSNNERIEGICSWVLVIAWVIQGIYIFTIYNRE